MPRYVINYNNLFGGVSSIQQNSDAKELINRNYKIKSLIYFPLGIKNINVLPEDVAKSIVNESNIFQNLTGNQINTIRKHEMKESLEDKLGDKLVDNIFQGSSSINKSWLFATENISDFKINDKFDKNLLLIFRKYSGEAIKNNLESQNESQTTLSQKIVFPDFNYVDKQGYRIEVLEPKSEEEGNKYESQKFKPFKIPNLEEILKDKVSPKIREYEYYLRKLFYLGEISKAELKLLNLAKFTSDDLEINEGIYEELIKNYYSQNSYYIQAKIDIKKRSIDSLKDQIGWDDFLLPDTNYSLFINNSDLSKQELISKADACDLKDQLYRNEKELAQLKLRLSNNVYELWIKHLYQFLSFYTSNSVSINTLPLDRFTVLEGPVFLGYLVKGDKTAYEGNKIEDNKVYLDTGGWFVAVTKGNTLVNCNPLYEESSDTQAKCVKFAKHEDNSQLFVDLTTNTSKGVFTTKCT